MKKQRRPRRIYVSEAAHKLLAKKSEKEGRTIIKTLDLLLKV